MENELTKFAKLLRENGADILSGSSKLTLSIDFLCTLNESFKLIVDQQDVMSSSFHVLSCSSDRAGLFCDLNFLHDFIQKSTSLKITPPHTAQHKVADISMFKNLKLLDLHNIDVQAIQGITSLRSRLQHLICVRCTNSASILELDDSDDTNDRKWNDLKEAVFSNNHWESIQFVTLMTNLHTLDLSHNDIENADDLNMLCNLKHLNLSYNKLKKMPDFDGPLCHLIQVLVLSCNFIEDLTSLSNLTNLRELDLSENCIVEHKALIPVANLATLQLLNLRGNPLSYHPQHRTRTACYLHVNTNTVRFVLDGKLLSKSEKVKIGSLHPRIRIRTSSYQSPSTSTEKPRRVRNVTITDQGYTPIIDNDQNEASSLVTSSEHLDAKRQIEQLKKQYGNEWLNSQAGSLVQDVLGIDKSPVLSSTPSNLPVEFPIEELTQPERADETTLEPYTSAVENLSVHDEPTDSDVYEQENVEEVVETPTSPSSEDDELGDGEENIFLATLINQEDPVFIVITKTHILERDCTTAVEKSRWPIETLTTCESDENVVTIYFDTIKNDARSRTYEWDNEESPKLLAAFRGIIERQPAPETKLKVYKCLKCSTQFNVEDAKTLFDDNVHKCPTCGSDLVFEDD